MDCEKRTTEEYRYRDKSLIYTLTYQDGELVSLDIGSKRLTKEDILNLTDIFYNHGLAKTN